jgi:excisionase family DNA binding protein
MSPSDPDPVQLLNESRERSNNAWNGAVEKTSASPLGLSTSQAARALGVSLGTIRRWSDMGYLESYRTPGGQRRFSREQIEQFIDSLHRQSREFRDRATGVGG